MTTPTTMPTTTPTTGLRAALEHEHREIDSGIEDFVAGRHGLVTAAQRLRDALAALRRHIYLEEEFLFPPLRATMLAPVFVMLAEHRDLWHTMDAIEHLLGNGARLEQQREACALLLAQLDRHNSKEEPIIYAQADVLLDTDARDSLATFLRDGRPPEGWVCQGA